MALISRRPRDQAGPIDQDFLDRAADMGDQRVNRYALFETYYDGDQETRLTDRAKLYLERSGLPYCENFCEPVVDVMAERLILTGFLAEQKTRTRRGLLTRLLRRQQTSETPPPVEQWCDEVMEANRFDALQGDVHTKTLVCGDGFLIVDWDERTSMPVFAWNHPRMVKPVYRDDRPDELDYVSKVWNSTAKGPQNPAGVAIVRLNLYYPDRIEKFFKAHSSGGQEGKGGWERWSDDGETGWPTPWVTAGGEPRGIPAVHFRHKSLRSAFGRSELRGVVPQQDALNKQLLDLHDVLDSQAWPQRYATGVTSDTADIRHKPGEYLTTSSDNAEFGQLDAADPSGILNAIEQTLSRIARRSRTPLHLLLGGDMPSGESLKSAESGLVKKVEQAATRFGNSWEDAFRIGLALAIDNGAAPDGASLDGLVLCSQWKSAQSRDEAGEAERATVLHDLGVSRFTLLTELGYDPEFEGEQRAMEQETLMDAAGALLDRGAGDRQRMNAGTAVMPRPSAA